MSTQTKWTPRLRNDAKAGWSIIWNGQFCSAMPDHKLAVECSLAPEMAEALRRYVSHLKLNGLSDPDASAILTKLEGGDK